MSVKPVDWWAAQPGYCPWRHPEAPRSHQRGEGSPAAGLPGKSRSRRYCSWRHPEAPRFHQRGEGSPAAGLLGEVPPRPYCSWRHPEAPRPHQRGEGSCAHCLRLIHPIPTLASSRSPALSPAGRGISCGRPYRGSPAPVGIAPGVIPKPRALTSGARDPARTAFA
jgi:hypothetical protein